MTILARWYQALVRNLAGVRADRRGVPFAPRHGTSLHVGYYLWQFPFPSETFIRREIGALRGTGVPLTVFADAPGDLTTMDAAERALTDSTVYLPPLSRPAIARWTLFFLVRRPATVVRLMAFVIGTRYEREKSASSDLQLFGRAVGIAVRVRAKGVTHLHSPWATTTAFIALIVSRLLNITYSVQARAHDLHREDAAFALPEKFTYAAFVVTNTRYNVHGIRALLPERDHARVHLIHNGIDLAQFAPPPSRARSPGEPLRLLCVARLIEPKGLTVLLQACASLRDRGIDLVCEIIGGSEEPLYTGYLTKLRVMHRQLRLGDHVQLAGPQPSSRVLEAYRDSDLFTLPCVVAANGSKDITPNVIIEAMAMELPVVSTRMTGIPEIVEDGVSGVLVPPGDAGALADAIEDLAADPERRIRFGRAGRQRVAVRFDIHRNIADYARLFRAMA